MRIYSMTATFGKLEHRTLTLEPGLNIIQAPNEWGKSTWCAFLTAMLYGIDTRARSSKGIPADKERYAPWSGSPMSGTICLNWKGRDITIERRSTGRLPLGQFRAYETATGLPVPELTGENCGRLLLGVERSVFVRAGFIRLQDMPVTQDDALRRRLNSLVTTGDDSGTAEALAGKLNQLKNRIQFNRSGLLPQAIAQRTELEQRLQELSQLSHQKEQLSEQKRALVAQEKQLKNHRISLAYRAAQETAARIAQAENHRNQLKSQLDALEQQCTALPGPALAAAKIAELQQLEAQWNSLDVSHSGVHFSPEQARKDGETYRKLKKKYWLIPLIPGLLALAAGVGLYLHRLPWLPAAILSGVLLTASLTMALVRRGLRSGLSRRYGSADPARWLANADAIARKTALEQTIREAAGTLSLSQAIDHWQQIQTRHDHLRQLRQAYQRAGDYLQILQDTAQPLIIPAEEDHLTYSSDETTGFLSENREKQQQVQLQLGQILGRMAQIGQAETLLAQKNSLQQRIDSLEHTLSAVLLAQNALNEATVQLQRRFAPALTRQAKELFCRMTGGRYDRLTLDEDFRLYTAAAEEDTLLSAGWRSDGTADQLYLSLRLAMARVLTPGAPLVLDDALVRFDDTRLRSVLDILQEESQTRQVLLFTCQSREEEILRTRK